MAMISTLLDRLRGLKASFAARKQEAAIRRRIAQEFADLGSRDLDRVLADLGCARDELPRLIENAPRSKPLLDAMILRLGLERQFAFAGPPLTRDIERRCATCPTQALCRRWLSKGGTAGEYRLFCPNAGNFDRLTDETVA